MPRISALPSLTTVDGTDELAVNDVSASTTKKATKSDLLKDAATYMTNSTVTTPKIADNAVTASKLATNAITLGYSQITAAFSTSSTIAVQVTGLTVSVTIPSGGRRVKVTAFCRNVYNAATAYNLLSIWDGTVGSGTQVSAAQTGSAANNSGFITAIAILSPAAGSKTYNVGLNCTGGSSALDANATAPAFILVEAI